jgi:fibro-slime domain-containing protein
MLALPARDGHLRVATWALVASVASVALVVGCASVRSPAGDTALDGGAAEADVREDVATGPVDRGAIERRPSDAGTIGCGNGRIDPEREEACDDGNVRGGDGCSADCMTIAKDFACPEVGKPCVYQIRCGDGVVAGGEGCDPPNAGAGCSADCRLESGYVCDPPPSVPDPAQPARCHRTVCGDGTREGAEACDDANLEDGDDCSALCTFEPDCSAGACVSRCGDAVKLAPEACDDGNTSDGDGCSRDCVVEAGFACQDTSMTPPAQLNLLVIYRDVISLALGAATRHPDFEIFRGDGITPNLVRATLDATGKPMMEGRCTQAAVSAQCPFGQQLTTSASFDQWYRDVAGVNIAVRSALLLPRLASGAYVFDSGAAGFHPVDGQGWTAPPARETAVADPDAGDGVLHNYGFTTEIRYFFQYRGGESLSFSGDDDVWIFVNRRLALDLGGMHTRLQATLNVDQSAAALGLVVGGLYEIALFHAERHSTGSNFKLTLTGFAPTYTACVSRCGDGLVAATEQCDDGNTVDGDGCSSDCRYEVTIQ